MDLNILNFEYYFELYKFTDGKRRNAIISNKPIFGIKTLGVSLNCKKIIINTDTDKTKMYSEKSWQS